jgi:hypothetical protein
VNPWRGVLSECSPGNWSAPARQCDASHPAGSSARHSRSPQCSRPRFARGAHGQRAQGHFDEAIKLLRRAIPSAIPKGFDATLDRLLHTAQGADGCRQIERRATEASLHILDLASAAGLYVSPIDRARLDAQLGDSRRALDSLDNALDIRDPGVVTLNADTAWDAVRTHPRFIEAVKRVGLPQA